MELSKLQRAGIFILAGLLLLGALALNMSLKESSPYGQVVEELRSRGYTLAEDDLYRSGGFPDSTIGEVLAGEELSGAVEASLAGGFPSDIHARGNIELLLLTMQNQDIVTIFARDGMIELCFVQRIGEEELRAVDQ